MKRLLVGAISSKWGTLRFLSFFSATSGFLPLNRSSDRNFFVGHEILNLNTWERKKIEIEGDNNEQALLTKNHLVAFPSVRSNDDKCPLYHIPYT